MLLKRFSKQGFEDYKLLRAQLKQENDVLNIRKAKHRLEQLRLHWISLESHFYLFTSMKKCSGQYPVQLSIGE